MRGFRVQGLGFRVWLTLMMLCVGVGAAQVSFGDDAAAAARKGHVTLVSDALVVPAGTPQFVELRFRVDEGFHVNSHKPKDELLIPTVLKLDTGAVRVVDQEYPTGAAFKLTVGDGEVLDVYQGEFRVKVKVVVPKGQSDLTGVLHYQACDASACFPPKSLPIKVAVTGK